MGEGGITTGAFLIFTGTIFVELVVELDGEGEGEGDGAGLFKAS